MSLYKKPRRSRNEYPSLRELRDLGATDKEARILFELPRHDNDVYSFALADELPKGFSQERFQELGGIAPKGFLSKKPNDVARWREWQLLDSVRQAIELRRYLGKSDTEPAAQSKITFHNVQGAIFEVCEHGLATRLALKYLNTLCEMADAGKPFTALDALDRASGELFQEQFVPAWDQIRALLIDE